MKNHIKNATAPRYFGPLMMFVAAVLFSSGGLLCKLIPWNALAINGVRNLLAASVVGVYLLIRRHKLVFNRYTFFGALCYIGTTTLYTLANKLTTAANTIVLQYTAPIWIILMMFLFFRQKPKRMELITISIVLIGILCFFFDSLSVGNLVGNLIAVLAGLCYGGLFILNSFTDSDSLSALLMGMLISGIFLSPTVFMETAFSPSVLVVVGLIGFVQVGAAYIFFAEGTGATHPVTASLIAAIEPVLNPLLVAIVIHEKIGVLSMLGAAIVVIAIVIYNILKSKQT